MARVHSSSLAPSKTIYASALKSSSWKLQYKQIFETWILISCTTCFACSPRQRRRAKYVSLPEDIYVGLRLALNLEPWIQLLSSIPAIDIPCAHKSTILTINEYEKVLVAKLRTKATQEINAEKKASHKLTA